MTFAQLLGGTALTATENGLFDRSSEVMFESLIKQDIAFFDGTMTGTLASFRSLKGAAERRCLCDVRSRNIDLGFLLYIFFK